MSIFPLPQFETDLKEHLDAEDRATYERLQIPKTLVVRFGAMKLVGEFPYEGTIKPGCGTKLIVRTHRGTELGEMLTSTCSNSGCSKSVSRKEMLEYIENSGGRDYPFFNNGRVLRVATPEDLQHQTKLEQSRHELKMDARRRAELRNIQVKIVDAEPILGNERLTFYYYAEERMDLHLLTEDLQRVYPETRVEMKLVGARDEARLTADYEKCGQYCCCKNFLKVLKPISMKSAKVQKATLDPLKISGRCGRLMCCLRYEDQTYEELAKRLPRKKARVGTPEGDGIVLEAQILTQLVMVLLDNSDKRVAIPVEDLTPPISNITPPPYQRPAPPPRRGGPSTSHSSGPTSGPTTGPTTGAPASSPAPRTREAAPQGPRSDRAPNRGPERGPDRGPERGPDRGPDRRSDRGPSRPPQPREGSGPDLVDFDDIETDTGDDFPPSRRGLNTGSGSGSNSGPNAPGADPGSPDGPRKKRRRKKKRPGSGPNPGPNGGPSGAAGPQTPPQERTRPDTDSASDRPSGPSNGPSQGPDGQRKRKRRRRRGSGGGSGAEGAGPGGNSGGSGGE